MLMRYFKRHVVIATRTVPYLSPSVLVSRVQRLQETNENYIRCALTT